MKIIGVLFTLIYIVFAAFWTLLLNVHGPGDLLYYAAGYLFVSLVALWAVYFMFRRADPKKGGLFFSLCAVVIGILLLIAIAATVPLLNKQTVNRNKERVMKTEVFGMKDELLLSQEGNPIGIRLTYAIRFPDSGYFLQKPSAMPQRSQGVSIWEGMRIIAQRAEPPLRGDLKKYEPGKLYQMSFDMVPYYFLKKRDKSSFCISAPPERYADAFQRLINNSEPMYFRVFVAQTKFETVTKNAYTTKSFYDSAVREGMVACDE